MRGCVPFCWPCAGARTLAPLRQGLLGRPGLFGKPCIGQALLVGPSAGVIRPAIAWLPRGGARAPGRVPSNLAPVVFSAATKCRGLFGASIVRKKCPCSKTARLRCPLGDRFELAKEPEDRTRAEPGRVARRDAPLHNRQCTRPSGPRGRAQQWCGRTAPAKRGSRFGPRCARASAPAGAKSFNVSSKSQGALVAAPGSLRRSLSSAHRVPPRSCSVRGVDRRGAT